CRSWTIRHDLHSLPFGPTPGPVREASAMTARVYLDWNATAPLRPEARAAMLAALDQVGNPSSVHAEGRAARGLVERARAQIAEAFGAEGSDIVFTSG